MTTQQTVTQALRDRGWVEDTAENLHAGEEGYSPLRGVTFEGPTLMLDGHPILRAPRPTTTEEQA